MADKEERILHIVQKLDGRFVGENRISAQEAIERMAKAAKKAYRGYFYTAPHHPNISDIMEAALNALLEDK